MRHALAAALILFASFDLSCAARQTGMDESELGIDGVGDTVQSDTESKGLGCPIACGAPAFQHRDLDVLRHECMDSDPHALDTLEHWYLSVESDAWRLFHDTQAEVSTADRRNFLRTYVEARNAPFVYGTVKLALVDSISTAALAWLRDNDVHDWNTYQRWIDRATERGERSESLQRCIEQMRRYVQGEAPANE